MVNTKLETQRKTILHFWLNDIRSAKEIHQRTKIPLRTIERNLQKLRETGTVERKHSSGRPSKVTQTLARSLGQHIRHNSASTTRQLSLLAREKHDIPVSHTFIWRHMKKKRGTKALYLLGLPC